jgi:L-malate glycosyltransferase
MEAPTQCSDPVISDPSHATQASGAVNPQSARPQRKVFFLVDSLNVGGTEVQAVELALRIGVKGYDVTLGCLRARGPLLERLRGSNVAIDEFYPKGGFDSVHGVYQMLRLAKFLRGGQFQVFHAHDLYSNILGIPAAVVARVPVIISSQRDLSHLDLYRTGKRAWVRRLQNLSTVVLTNSKAVRDSVLTDHNFAPEKIRVIYNGVDTDRWVQGGRDRTWLAADGAGETWIVLVGNMHSGVKGHPFLIAAAPEVVRKFPKTRFVLVGDGAQRPDFEQQVAQLGLQRNFLFLGRRDDVPRVLSVCDIAVLPSKAEGLPNAVLEYMATGLPTIATRVGGNAEIIQDGKNGLLVPAEDSSALADAMLRMLRDPAFSARLGQNGREFVLREFSFARLIENTDQLYTELLRSRGLQ